MYLGSGIACTPTTPYARIAAVSTCSAAWVRGTLEVYSFKGTGTDWVIRTHIANSESPKKSVNTHFQGQINMPRPRTPLAKAKATGQDIIHATRFKNRKEPASLGPLGAPPIWMKKKDQRDSWETFRDEIPWLNKSHRCLTVIACIARADLISGAELNVRMANLLRQCLGQMAATPTDSSKVTLPDDEDAKDPANKYF